jgi:hypothetical protein
MKRIPIAAALALVTLAGCADTDGSAGSATATPTAPASPTASSPASPAADPAALAAQIEQQVATKPTVRVTLDTAVKSGSTSTNVGFEGVIRTEPGRPPAMHLKMKTAEAGKTGTGEVILLDKAFYVRSGEEEFAQGKPWLRMSRADLEALDEPAAAPLKALLGQLFDQMDQAVRGASVTGNLTLIQEGEFTAQPKTETLGGETVTRYDGTTDPAAAASEDESYRTLARAGVEQIPWTIWVGDDGLPRQFAMTMQIPTRRGTVETTSKAVYSGWGDPVTIEAPPPAEVATLTDLSG